MLVVIYVAYSFYICLKNFLGFGQSAEVDIVFDGSENRKLAEVKTEDGKKEKYLLYYDGEAVSGKVIELNKLVIFTLSHHCFAFCGVQLSLYHHHALLSAGQWTIRFLFMLACGALLYARHLVHHIVV